MLRFPSPGELWVGLVASKEGSGLAQSRKRAEKGQGRLENTWNRDSFASKTLPMVAKMSPKKPQGSQHTGKGRKGLSPTWTWRSRGLEGPTAADSRLCRGLGMGLILEGSGSSTPEGH